ncbi:MAG: ZIP family metal transporter [Chloroflexi bacterium]|nr:ZIP family metal transporter [Chloroflexota bacterium]
MPLAALLPFVSTMLGGIAAFRLRHRLHPFMALAAGVLVATAVADLLPEALRLAGETESGAIGVAAVAGFLLFSLIEAFIHQGSFEHQHAAGEHHDEAGPITAPRTSITALLPPTSLILHSTLDGLAIGIAFQAGADTGLIVLLAVLAHDFADGLNVVTLALEAARGIKLAAVLLVLDALAPLVGAGLSRWVSISPGVLGLLLAWFAGVFLAIGAGHLLPEAQHDQPRRGPVLVGLATVGALIVLAVRAMAG